MSPQARLVARYGPLPRQEYSLSEGTNTIGREAINDVFLDDSEISRRHARIVISGGQVVIEDLGSTNGTFVNGVEIQQPTLLVDGTEVDFGETQRFLFHGPTSAPGGATLIETPGDADATDVYAPVGPGAADPYLPADAGAVDSWAATMMDAPALPDHPPTVIEGPSRPSAAEATVPLSGPPSAPAPTAPAAPAAAAGRGRLLLLGCGGGLLLAGLVILITLFVLDAAAPDLLYCGALQPVAEFVAGLSGQTLVCP